ncbi:MAG: DUF177 domain-containing protein [Bacteroidales bacterium]|nr:DUF177 domain-containing protein [Bacteroidales bacterium]
MSIRNKYRIEYKQLEKGKHTINYKINSNFFNLFEYSEIKNGQIDVDIELENNGNLFIADINLSGFIKTECDICLEEFDLEVKNKFNLFFKFTEEELDDDNDVIFISPNDDFIDFSKHLYDYIILSLPIKKVHPLNSKGERVCNSEVLEQLDTFAPTEKLINSPEWEKLKSLYNK